MSIKKLNCSFENYIMENNKIKDIKNDKIYDIGKYYHANDKESICFKIYNKKKVVEGEQQYSIYKIVNARKTKDEKNKTGPKKIINYGKEIKKILKMYTPGQYEDLYINYFQEKK